MKTIVSILIITIIAGLASEHAVAADRFVRQGASGNGSGSDWTNAYPTLPASLVRGDTYYIADGSYGGYTFDDPVSGTTVITVRKCTTTDAVSTATAGYSSAYCDGQATFGGIVMVTSHYAIDGVRRNEGNWSDIAAYGIRASSFQAHRINYSGVGSNVTIRYVDIGSADGTICSTTVKCPTGVYLGGFNDSTPQIKNWVLSRVHIHNVNVGILMNSVDGFTIEFSMLRNTYNKEAIRGQAISKNVTVQHNSFVNTCLGLPGDSTAGACTAQIASWGSSVSGAYDGYKVHGNMFWQTTGTLHTNGCIVVGGNGSSLPGVSANNSSVNNNTISGIVNAYDCRVGMPGGGTGNSTSNNLWYDIGTSPFGCFNSINCANNVRVTSSPFVNAAAGDFRLAQATAAGTILSVPFNSDRSGATRGDDGSWDLGAYEYSGSVMKPKPPTEVGAD